MREIARMTDKRLSVITQLSTDMDQKGCHHDGQDDIINKIVIGVWWLGMMSAMGSLCILTILTAIKNKAKRARCQVKVSTSEENCAESQEASLAGEVRDDLLQKYAFISDEYVERTVEQVVGDARRASSHSSLHSRPRSDSQAAVEAMLQMLVAPGEGGGELETALTLWEESGTVRDAPEKKLPLRRVQSDHLKKRLRTEDEVRRISWPDHVTKDGECGPRKMRDTVVHRTCSGPPKLEDKCLEVIYELE